MREAIGGGWIMGFIAMFIVIFSGYLAISVNYTKAFKAKNKIINIIEENGGFTEDNTSVAGSGGSSLDVKSSSTESKINDYLKEIGYNYDKGASSCKFNDEQGTAMDRGYCVYRVCSREGGAYYKVRTFINFTVPIVNLSVSVPINGETKVIYNDISSDEYGRVKKTCIKSN